MWPYVQEYFERLIDTARYGLLCEYEDEDTRLEVGMERLLEK
jgi:hypothetical protein